MIDWLKWFFRLPESNRELKDALQRIEDLAVDGQCKGFTVPGSPQHHRFECIEAIASYQLENSAPEGLATDE